MDEEYSFNPGGNKETLVKDENWMSKDIEKWDWRDFYAYYDHVYEQKLEEPIPWLTMKERGAKKKVIELTYKNRGKALLKAMIDWLFDNYKKYPQWTEVNIGLILGNHGWAKMIAEQAKKQMALDKRWERE